MDFMKVAVLANTSGYLWNGRRRRLSRPSISSATCLPTTACGACTSRQIVLENRAGLSTTQGGTPAGPLRGSLLERVHHHVTLVMLAHSFLTVETLRNKKTSGWTLPRTHREIQRLLCTWTGSCCHCGEPTRGSIAT